MDTRRTFYKVNGDRVSYSQIELLGKHVVMVKTDAHGGKPKIARKQFPDLESALDQYMDLVRKHKEEPHVFPWTCQIKFTMNLEKQKSILSKEEFAKLIDSIYETVDDHLWENVNGSTSSGVKKVKGALYSIKVYLIDKNPAVEELSRKLQVISGCAEINAADAREQVFTSIPQFTGMKALEVEFWTEDYGFIFLTMTLGDQVYETRFSNVWDPTEDFRRWLEAICVGVEHCCFCIQNEGQDTKFNFERRGPDQGVFYAGWDRHEMDMVEHVDRRQFVETLYNAYSTFLDPNNFSDTERWGDDLANKFKSKLIEEYLRYVNKPT